MVQKLIYITLLIGIDRIATFTFWLFFSLLIGLHIKFGLGLTFFAGLHFRVQVGFWPKISARLQLCARSNLVLNQECNKDFAKGGA